MEYIIQREAAYMTIDEYIVSKFGESQGSEIIKEMNEELTKSEPLCTG